MQKYIYGNFANFNPRAILSTLHAERTMRCKIVYFTRQRFARVIIDTETLRRFVNTSCISVSAVALRGYSFHKCILMIDLKIFLIVNRIMYCL